MNNVKAIRQRLAVTQDALARGIGCTQGNVGHYEHGQMFPPEMARRLIEFAATQGLRISYNDIYCAATPITTTEPATAGGCNV